MSFGWRRASDIGFIEAQGHHSLDALERGEGIERNSGIEPSGAGRRRRSLGDFEPLQLSGSFGARKLGVRPEGNAANPLVGGELSIGAAHDFIGMGSGIEDQYG